MKKYFVMNDASLKRYNTLRLEVSANTVILPHTIDGFAQALKDYKDREIIIIGNGSNMMNHMFLSLQFCSMTLHSKMKKSLQRQELVSIV